MAFGDGIAAVQVEREEKYGKFWAWVLFFGEFALMILGAGMFIATVIMISVWAEGSDTLVHVVRDEFIWLWHLLGRIA